MTLSVWSYLILCPLLFLAGLVDSIGGGGGLISLPAYLLVGLPAHTAVATNKLSSAFGTSLTTARFLRNGLVNLRLAIPSAGAALAGAALGARLSLLVDEGIMKWVLLGVLPLTALVVLNPRLFPDREDGRAEATPRTLAVCIACAFLIGSYDGFYGPGTGTFLIIAFTALAGMGVKAANAQAKVINLSSNIASLTVFLLNGQVLIPLGLAGAASSMLGNWVGSGLALKRGGRIVRPVVLLVLGLLLVKAAAGY